MGTDRLPTSAHDLQPSTIRLLIGRRAVAAATATLAMSSCAAGIAVGAVSGGDGRGATTEAPTAEASHYVALGDSVAAGEGIGEGWSWNGQEWVGAANRLGQVWDTTFQPSACHQSPEGYPHVVAAERGLALTDLACTGATSGDLLGEPAETHSAAQLGGAYERAEPAVVTLSLGADDVGLVNRLDECYAPGLLWLQANNPAVDLPLGLPDCTEDLATLPQDLERQRSGLRSVLERIEQLAGAAEHAPVVVITGYYDPFGEPYDSGCPDLDVPDGAVRAALSSADVTLARQAVEALNASIAEVVAEFDGASGHQLDPILLGAEAGLQEHALCSAAGPWLYGPSLLFAVPNVVAAAEAQTTAAERKAPFHPTPQGQRTIGEAVARVVENARPVPTGSDVAVPMGDGELTFNAVTHRGVAEIVPAADLPGQLPSPDDFKLQAAYLVAASAAHSGGVEVSLPAGSGLALFHYVEGKWQQVQSSFNGTYLSGTATSLSWFAVGTPVAAVQAVLGPATAGEAPAPVTLDASQSTVDGGGAIASYSWDFGDGATGSGPTPTHVYADAGTYRVTVTVTAQDGAVDTAAEAVTVTHAAPHAVIETPSHLVAGEPAQFGAAASSASAGPVVWDTWVFGDGSEPAAGAVVTHTFHNPGTYRVLLSVRDGQGYTDAVTTPVTVTANQSAGTGGNGGRVAPAHRAPVRVGGRAVRRGLRILVALACPGGTGDCVGTLLVRRAQGGHYRMLGSVRYRVKAGAIKTVGVTIPRRRAHLALPGTKVSLLATEANGGEVAASRRLKRPSPRRRR